MDTTVNFVKGSDPRFVSRETDVNGMNTITVDLRSQGGEIEQVDYYKGFEIDPKVRKARNICGQLRMLEHIDNKYGIKGDRHRPATLFVKEKKEAMVNLLMNGLQSPGIFPVSLTEKFESRWNPQPTDAVLVDYQNARILMLFDMYHIKRMSHYYLRRDHTYDIYHPKAYKVIDLVRFTPARPEMVWESNGASGLPYTNKFRTSFPTLKELCIRAMFSSWNVSCGRDQFGPKVFDGTNNLYDTLESSIAKMFRPQIMPKTHCNVQTPEGLISQRIWEPAYVGIAMKWFTQLNGLHKQYPQPNFGNRASMNCTFEHVDVNEVRLPNKDAGLLFNANDPKNVEIKIPLPDAELIQVVKGNKKLFAQGMQAWVHELLDQVNLIIRENGGLVPTTLTELSDFVWKLSPKHEKHFWTDSFCNSHSSRMALKKKLRLFFIPCGMAYIIAYMLQKPRMMYERGHYIRVGMKWLDGGAKVFYDLMGGGCTFSIYFEGDFSAFDLSVLPNFLALYTLSAQFYKDKESYEGSNYQALLEYYATQLTGKIMRYFSGKWRMVIGQMPSGDFNTSHGDSWVNVIVWLSYIVYVYCKHPEYKKRIIETLKNDQLFNAVFGDDWLMRVPKDLEHVINGPNYAWWVKAVYGMEIKPASLKRFETLLTAVDQISGSVLIPGPKFLKKHLIQVVHEGEIHVVAFRPVCDYFARVFHYVSSNYNDIAILCKLIGLWWDNVSNDCAAKFIYFCWKRITERIYEKYGRHIDLAAMIMKEFERDPGKYDKYLKRMGVKSFLPRLVPLAELRDRYRLVENDHLRYHYLNFQDYY